jgi:hypothetical protein
VNLDVVLPVTFGVVTIALGVAVFFIARHMHREREHERVTRRLNGESE